MKHYSTVISLSRRLLDEIRLPPNHYLFANLINCYCHLNRLDFAFSELGKMMKLGFQPDHVTFNNIVNGLVVNNDLKQASLLSDLLRKMESLELSRMRSYTPPSLIASLRFQPLGRRSKHAVRYACE